MRPRNSSSAHMNRAFIVESENQQHMASCSGEHRIYRASALELTWKAWVDSGPDKSRGWDRSCSLVRNQSQQVAEWLSVASKRETSRESAKELDEPGSALDTTVLSRHDFVDCQGRLVRRVPLEPLVSFLRHPRAHCINRYSHHYTKSYLLPLWAFEMPPRPPTARNFLFDCGASTFKAGTGGASQQWFVEAYAARGIEFDRILAWEALNMTAERIFRNVPARWMDVLSYYNLPVDPVRQAPLLGGTCALVYMAHTCTCPRTNPSFSPGARGTCTCPCTTRTCV